VSPEQVSEPKRGRRFAFIMDTRLCDGATVRSVDRGRSGRCCPAGARRCHSLGLGLAVSSRQVREQVLVPDQHLVRSDVRGTRGRSKGGQHEAFVGKARKSWRPAENDEVR